MRIPPTIQAACSNSGKINLRQFIEGVVAELLLRRLPSQLNKQRDSHNLA
jgi:hypothetical protein